jgi:hypothetical protein
MAASAAQKLAKANFDKKDLKAQNQELSKELRAQKREFNKEVATLATVGGLSATAGAVAGAKIQAYFNTNYDAESKLRALTPEIPTLSIIGAIVAVAGVGLAKDNMTRAAIGGLGGGLAGGAYLEGTGLA